MKIFLDHYAQFLHIGKACDAAKIHRTQFYKWIDDDKDSWFREQVDAIEGHFADDVESKVRERVLGINKDKTGDWYATQYWLENRVPKRWKRNPALMDDDGNLNPIHVVINEIPAKPQVKDAHTS